MSIYIIFQKTTLLTYNSSNKIHCRSKLGHSLQLWARVRASCPAFIPSGLTLPLLDYQGQLCCVAQARYRSHSPECCSWWGIALLLLWPQGHFPIHHRWWGMVGRGHLSSAHTTVWQMRSGDRFPMLMFLGQFTHTPVNRVSSTVQGALSWVLQMVRGSINSLAHHSWQGQGEHLSLTLPTT